MTILVNGDAEVSRFAVFPMDYKEIRWQGVKTKGTWGGSTLRRVILSKKGTLIIMCMHTVGFFFPQREQFAKCCAANLKTKCSQVQGF